MRKARIIPIRHQPATQAVQITLLKAELTHVKRMARQALFKYGQHGEGCPTKFRATAICDCGLLDAIGNLRG